MARQSSAKACTAVRIRSTPQTKAPQNGAFLINETQEYDCGLNRAVRNRSAAQIHELPNSNDFHHIATTFVKFKDRFFVYKFLKLILLEFYQQLKV